MNKTELINAISEKSGLTKKDSEAALNATLKSIEEALVKGDKISLIGFGTFDVRERAAREGKNPQTGAKIKIAASKSPAFKAGSSLKNAVNGK